jgi:hypothetical protein
MDTKLKLCFISFSCMFVVFSFPMSWVFSTLHQLDGNILINSRQGHRLISKKHLF